MVDAKFEDKEQECGFRMHDFYDRYKVRCGLIHATWTLPHKICNPETCPIWQTYIILVTKLGIASDIEEEKNEIQP